MFEVTKDGHDAMAEIAKKQRNPMMSQAVPSQPRLADEGAMDGLEHGAHGREMRPEHGHGPGQDESRSTARGPRSVPAQPDMPVPAHEHEMRADLYTRERLTEGMAAGSPYNKAGDKAHIVKPRALPVIDGAGPVADTVSKWGRS